MSLFWLTLKPLPRISISVKKRICIMLKLQDLQDVDDQESKDEDSDQARDKNLNLLQSLSHQV